MHLSHNWAFWSVASGAKTVILHLTLLISSRWQKQHRSSKIQRRKSVYAKLLNCMNACPILLQYSVSRANDQTWWQAQSEEETEPTKGNVTGSSTTDVSTEGSLLSTEQSHTWETPKSSGNRPENVCSLVKTLPPAPHTGDPPLNIPVRNAEGY